MTDTDRLDLEPELANALAFSAATGQFRSILFRDDIDLAPAEPAFFADLNLDQVVEAVVAGRDEYDLKPFFHTPLRDSDAIEFRHEVLRDLESDEVRAAVRALAGEMQQVRRYLTLVEKQHYKYEKERWFLDAAAVYCAAVSALRDALAGLQFGSRGFQGLRDYLATYTSSERFAPLTLE